MVFSWRNMELLVSISIASFIVGWFTCSATYFWKSARLSATIVKLSYVFYLVIVNKALELFFYSHLNQLEALRKNDKSYGHEEYERAKVEHEKEVEDFKAEAMFYLIHAHPEIFKGLLTFKDWRGARKFLIENKEVVKTITKGVDDA
jgi:hypothetical protein